MSDNYPVHRRQCAGGYALVASLTALLVVTVAATVGMHYLMRLRTGHAARSRVLSAFHLAEAGLAKAQWELARGNLRYRGEKGLALGGGTIDIKVTRNGEDAVYDVEASCRVVRGSGLPSQRTVRAQMTRSKEGVVKVTAWSQVSASTKVKEPAGTRSSGSARTAQKAPVRADQRGRTDQAQQPPLRP